MNTKKHLIVLVLKLLETNSDEEHPMTQTAIAGTISDVYPCDRKTVGRNIRSLVELGYPIVKTGRGFYMKKKQFSPDEIAFMVEAIRNGDGKPENERAVLADELSEVLTKIYKR